MHHLDSWIKKDQLDVTCFIISLFTAQHVSNVSTSILRSLRLIVDLFHVLYCSGSMCVDVTVWFSWGWVVSLSRLNKLCINMFRMLVHPSSGACDLLWIYFMSYFIELFHGLYCSGTMCVGVTVLFGWGGVVSLCRLKQCYGYTTPAKPHRNINTHRTRAIQHMK